MLNIGRFPTQLHCNVVLLHNPTVKLLQITPKIKLSNSPFLNFGDVLVNRLRYNARGTKKNGGFGVGEMEGSDEFDFDEDFLDYSEMEDGSGEDEDDEVVIHLKNMKKWVENRPRGFGEGKVYDTTIEDKLMEEIEQSRRAQLANLNKLKNNPHSKKETRKKDKDITKHSDDGFRVRLVNLPKKKNIHRDLRVAFQGVSGIANIVPVVSGNEKTRDPVCKGLAFVDFKNQNEAQRFVQNFSGKPILFGTVEKQIKCEMVKPQASKSEFDQKSDLNSDENSDGGSDADVPLSCSSEEIEVEDDTDERFVTAQWEEEEEDDDGGMESQKGEESVIDHSSSSKQKRRPKKKHKKKVASSPKLNIPGSAKKLKIREQALLSGVFSKYGAAAASVNE